ncbi:hypothetical protein SDJN03_20850, partial [Cucurbita argyrosperma subsp. sororia]
MFALLHFESACLPCLSQVSTADLISLVTKIGLFRSSTKKIRVSSRQLNLPDKLLRAHGKCIFFPCILKNRIGALNSRQGKAFLWFKPIAWGDTLLEPDPLPLPDPDPDPEAEPEPLLDPLPEPPPPPPPPPPLGCCTAARLLLLLLLLLLLIKKMRKQKRREYWEFVGLGRLAFVERADCQGADNVSPFWASNTTRKCALIVPISGAAGGA